MIAFFGIHALALIAPVEVLPPPPPVPVVVAAPGWYSAVPSATFDATEGLVGTTGADVIAVQAALPPETDDEYHARIRRQYCDLKPWACGEVIS